MITYFIERINRQISKLIFVYSFSSVNLDQITIGKTIFVMKTEIIKTPKK